MRVYVDWLKKGVSHLSAACLLTFTLLGWREQPVVQPVARGRGGRARRHFYAPGFSRASRKNLQTHAEIPLSVAKMLNILLYQQMGSSHRKAALEREIQLLSAEWGLFRVWSVWNANTAGIRSKDCEMWSIMSIKNGSSLQEHVTAFTQRRAPNSSPASCIMWRSERARNASVFSGPFIYLPIYPVTPVGWSVTLHDNMWFNGQHTVQRVCVCAVCSYRAHIRVFPFPNVNITSQKYSCRHTTVSPHWQISLPEWMLTVSSAQAQAMGDNKSAASTSTDMDDEQAHFIFVCYFFLPSESLSEFKNTKKHTWH